jgi:RHS repeat-associated protein
MTASSMLTTRPCVCKFTGKEHDYETGLDYFGARFDSSSFGRFMTPDDFTKDSDVRDPQRWNKYAYARNNPMRYTDPTGGEATASVTGCTTDSNGHRSCSVSVTAAIAIYSVNGTTADQLKQDQSAITDQIDKAWSGSFEQNDTTYNVSTNVTVSIVGNEDAGVKSGAQNVIGIDSSGKTESSSVEPNVIHSYDKGVWDYSQVIGGGFVPHEFSHLLGLDDNHGDVISNSNYAVAGTGRKATDSDFQWALGPELARGRTKFNVGVQEGWDFVTGNNRGNRHWWEGYKSRN